MSPEWTMDSVVSQFGSIHLGVFSMLPVYAQRGRIEFCAKEKRSKGDYSPRLRMWSLPFVQ